MTTSDITAKTTHDLWVEARRFELDISRPTPTTINLKVTYPTSMTVVDGAVVLVHERALNSTNYPDDGVRYDASADLAAPADRIEGNDGARVVAFYSGILGTPLTGTPDVTTGTTSFSITVTNADPNTLYYASIHACTNVLQYYPIGIQSYPLEASRIEKDSSSYTGGIPSLPEAPTAPTPGFVYYDKGLGIVQYWSGTQWIPTRADSILSGPYNPGAIGQVYFYTGLSQLKVFSGTKWEVCTPANLQFLTPSSTWVPLGTVAAVIKLPDAPAVGDFVWNYTTQRGQFWDGTTWLVPTASNSLFLRPPLTPAFTTAIYADSIDLAAPYVGQLFYNTTTRVLNVFNGSGWIQANTDQQGTVISDKVGVGTDGSYDERLRLIKVLKGQLGWPVQCVELQEEQFNIAIDNALDNYRAWCDAAYTRRFVLFTLLEGQQIYYLNNAADGTDKVVTVSKVHRLNILGANSLSWDSNIFFQTFLNQYYSAGYTDMLSIHLMHSLSEDYQRIFAGDMTFLWDEPSRELMLTRRVSRTEKVILECFMERTEQEIVLDRYAKQFIQNWALAEAKMQLGMIRSKYSSGTPGAAGGINLNGEMLISEARTDMTELKEELLNNEYGGLTSGNSSFLIG